MLMRLAYATIPCRQIHLQYLHCRPHPLHILHCPSPWRSHLHSWCRDCPTGHHFSQASHRRRNPQNHNWQLRPGKTMKRVAIGYTAFLVHHSSHDSTDTEDRQPMGCRCLLCLTYKVKTEVLVCVPNSCMREEHTVIQAVSCSV